jgi:hypothetical protein
MHTKVVLGILALLIVSGCTQLPASGETDAAKLQDIELRYIGRGTIAPGDIQSLDLMQQELNVLRSKSTPAVQEMIDIRLSLLSFSRHYLQSEVSRWKISPLTGQCGTTDPLQITIGRLDRALALEAGITQRIRTFEANNPGSRTTTNISLLDFQEFAQTLQNSRDEMHAFYQENCV